jgi:predicted DNA binding CopG/RHH family protein
MKNKKTVFIPDEYELELIESINNEEWISVQNFEKEKKRFQNIALATLKDITAIQIKIQKKDIDAIRKRSKEIGIPVQTLISALIHNFAEGQINLKFE